MYIIAKLANNLLIVFKHTQYLKVSEKIYDSELYF